MYWVYLCNLQFQTEFRELHTKIRFCVQLAKFGLNTYIDNIPEEISSNIVCQLPSFTA